MDTVYTILWTVACLAVLVWLIYMVVKKKILPITFVVLLILWCVGTAGIYGLIDIGIHLG